MLRSGDGRLAVRSADRADGGARARRPAAAAGWAYAPKWDGFRALAWSAGADGEPRLDSRNRRPLLHYFPELRAALEALPAGTVADGEIVVVRGDATDFDAVLAWRTAWLKAHRPAEFMAAVLASSGSRSDSGLERVAQAVAECARMDIRVLPPDVNRSEPNFSIEEDGEGRSIRFGLARIRQVGEGAAREIAGERERNGPFESIADFAGRLPLGACGRTTIEALARSGALDRALGEGETRADAAASADRIHAAAQIAARNRDTGQLDLFAAAGAGTAPQLELERGGRATVREIGNWERDLLGTYVSGHPFREDARRLASAVTAQTSELGSDMAGQEAVVAGVVQTVRRLTSRRGEPFAALVVEDLAGSAGITVRPQDYGRWQELIEHGKTLIAKVAVRERDGRTAVAAAQIADASADAPPFGPALFGGARQAEETPPHAAEEPDGGGEPPREAEPRPEDAPAPDPATVVATLRPSGDEEADRLLVRTLLGRECPGSDELRLHVEDGEQAVTLRVARGVDAAVFAPWAARKIGGRGSAGVFRGPPSGAGRRGRRRVSVRTAYRRGGRTGLPPRRVRAGATAREGVRMTGIDDAGTGAGAEAKTPGGSRQAVCPNCGWPRPIVAFTGMCGECTVRERDPGNGETARAPGGRPAGSGEGSIG